MGPVPDDEWEELEPREISEKDFSIGRRFSQLQHLHPLNEVLELLSRDFQKPRSVIVVVLKRLNAWPEPGPDLGER